MPPLSTNAEGVERLSLKTKSQLPIFYFAYQKPDADAGKLPGLAHLIAPCLGGAFNKMGLTPDLLVAQRVLPVWPQKNWNKPRPRMPVKAIKKAQQVATAFADDREFGLTVTTHANNIYEIIFRSCGAREKIGQLLDETEHISEAATALVKKRREPLQLKDMDSFLLPDLRPDPHKPMFKGPDLSAPH